jgi:hypothetical protein
MTDPIDRRQSNKAVPTERRVAQRRKANQPVIRERRLSRRAVDLLEVDATPVRPWELALWTGFSEAFIRDDIRHGIVQATKVTRRGRHVYVVPVPEAIRYLRTLGVTI